MMNTYLISVVRKVDFMKYLRCFVLDGLHFDLMWRILALAAAQRLLQPIEAVGGDRMMPSP